MVKQLSVFLENKKGRLATLTSVLKENNINLVALSIADTTNFGILRAIVKQPDEAVAALKEAGFTASIADVLACLVPDRPGGLADMLMLMNEHDVNVEYLYSFVRTPGKEALIILRVDKLEEARNALQGAGMHTLTHEETIHYQ